MNILVPILIATLVAIIVRFLMPVPSRLRPGLIGDIMAAIVGSLVAAFFFMQDFTGPYGKGGTLLMLLLGTIVLLTVFSFLQTALKKARKGPRRTSEGRI